MFLVTFQDISRLKIFLLNTIPAASLGSEFYSGLRFLFSDLEPHLFSLQVECFKFIITQVLNLGLTAQHSRLRSVRQLWPEDSHLRGAEGYINIPAFLCHFFFLWHWNKFCISFPWYSIINLLSVASCLDNLGIITLKHIFLHHHHKAKSFRSCDTLWMPATEKKAYSC